MFKTKKDQTIDRLTKEVEALLRSQNQERGWKQEYRTMWRDNLVTAWELILAVEEAWADGIIDHDRGADLYELTIESKDALEES